MTFGFEERPATVRASDISSRYGAVLALQGASAAVPSASSAMRTLVLLLAALVASAGLIRGEIKTPQNAPD